MKSIRMDIFTPTVVFVTALFAFNIALCRAQSGSNNIENNKATTIKINGKTLFVELATTEEERQRGLMFREKLEKDHGMFFIFPKVEYASFWMKNTLIPLSIAYIKDDGCISQIEDMEPQSLKSHPSAMKVKFVLEMNKGWFERNGVKVGDYIETKK